MDYCINSIYFLLTQVDILKQFLEFDRRVLRFYCVWDDRKSMFGDIRELILHYFLADGTIEIKEVVPPNSGRDAAPIFLRRQRCVRLIYYICIEYYLGIDNYFWSKPVRRLPDLTIFMRYSHKRLKFNWVVI